MDWKAFIKYPVVFAAAFFSVLLLTPLVRKAARCLGMVDKPDSRRIHSTPTPRGGGVAVFLGFHIACAVIFLFPWDTFQSLMKISWWLRFLPSSLFLLIVGIIDDYRGMRPWVKLLGQLATASAVYFCGMNFANLLKIPPSTLFHPLDYCLTVIWVLAFINAFNLIDGMDGLASSLAIIAAIGIGGSMLLRHSPGDVLVLLALAGACAAFLVFNHHPASIFLGDSGSMFIGLTLAAASLATHSKATATATIGIPMLAIGIPLFDTLLAIWRRSVRLWLFPSGKSRIMSADTDHLHHRLLKSGLSQNKAAWLLVILNTFLVTVALLALFLKNAGQGLYLIAFLIATYVIVRHMARIELWDSGAALLQGLRRPAHRALPMVIYVVFDLVALSLLFGFTLWITNPTQPWDVLKHTWLHRAPLWVGVPFIICYFPGHAHRRIWSKARITDYAKLGLALVAGILTVLGIALSVSKLNNLPEHLAALGREYSLALLLEVILYAGLAVPACVGIRTMIRVIQDAMALAPALPNRRITLVYGTGDMCSLFLRQRTLTSPPGKDGRRIAGLLLDDPNTHGREVYGHRALGGFNQIEAIMARQRIDELVCACLKPEPAMIERLRKLARKTNMRVTLWSIEEKILEMPAAAPDARSAAPKKT